MISSISWIPAGAANPNPTKYEISPAEQELIRKMMEQAEQGDDNNEEEGSNVTKTSRIVLPKADPSLLPLDLRMDEYSDDDDDNNGVVAGMSIGRLLLNNNDNDSDDNNAYDGNMEDDDDDSKNSNDSEKKDPTEKPRSNNDDDDDFDDEDNLEDVPDTREYMPVNIEALQAMNIGGTGGAGGNNKKKKNKYHKNHDNDDIVEDDDDVDGDISDDDTEVDDVLIQETDALVLVAKTEDDFPTLEVHVYDTTNGNLYVHHDIALPSFPLCVEHGRIIPSNYHDDNNVIVGNYCAVGTFHPGIEIWNLDVLNVMEPSYVLGGTNTSSITDEILQYQMLNNTKNKKKQKNSIQTNNNNSTKNGGGLKPESHTDAVLSLSWNRIHQHVLGSGSADMTVKIWDLTHGTVASTLQHHTNKVSALEWNPQEATLLATGSYDRTIHLVDARTASSSSNQKYVTITGDCEGIRWDPNKCELVTVLSDDGKLTCWDVRKFSTKEPIWTLSGVKGVSDISYNRHVPGLLASCSSIDKTVSLWDTYKEGSCPVQATATTSELLSSYVPCRPNFITSKDMCGGKLYSVSFYPSLPWLLGCGGSGNQLSLWDLSYDETNVLHKRFERRVAGAASSEVRDNNNQLRNDTTESLFSSTNSNEQQEEQGSNDDHVIDDNEKKSKKKTKKNKNSTKKKKAHRSGL